MIDEEEWRHKVVDAYKALISAQVHLEGDSIAAYRGLIAKLDAAVFEGFHILHRQLSRNFKATTPTKFTLEDL